MLEAAVLSCVSWAECSLALRRRAAILEARRSAAEEDMVGGVEEEQELDGLPRMGTGLLTAAGIASLGRLSGRMENILWR